MASTFNYFFRVNLTLAKYEGGAKGTKTVDFTSKTLKDSSAVSTYWPILRSVGEVSYGVSDSLPTLTVGSVQIDNSVGSFGTGRKFSDLLQPGYYTPCGQQIIIYVAQVANDTDTVGSWTPVVQGVVADWEAPIADGVGTVVFNIQPFKFDEKFVTLEVTRSVSGMESAPDGSLGRAVPLIIGDDQTVLPVRISADGATTAKYAWGTCFYQHLQNDSGNFAVYSKNYDDDWEAVDTGSNGTTIYATPAPGYPSYTLNTYDARAFKISITQPCIVTGIRLFGNGNSADPLRNSDAFLDVFILRVDSTTRAVVEDPVAQGTVDLSYYDASNNISATSIAITVSFDRPAFLSTAGSKYDYYFGWKVRNWAVNELSLEYATTTVPELRIDNGAGDTSDGSWRYAGTNNVPTHVMLEVVYQIDDHVDAYTQSGLTYSSLSIVQHTPDSGQSNPHFDNLPIAFRPEQGLVAYPGGGATIDRPTTLANYLGYVWNTSTNTWQDPLAWDSTTLDSTHYSYLYAGSNANYRSRTARGVFDTKTTFAQVIAELSRGTASRVGVLSTGKAFMYPWGVTVTPAFNIPYADVSALTWQQRDLSTVVNRCVINLGKNYITPPREFENADDTKAGFLYSTDFSAVNFAQVRDMTSESRAMYGNRDLAATSFPIWPYQSTGGGYLGNSSSEGSVLADFYLSRFAKPLVYASFIVPWHRYSSLKMFDVITFSTPAFPAYYGTDPDPRQNWVVDTGSEVTTVDVNSSYDLVQAQTYRGLVEGITYVMAMEHAPTLKVTVLVLQNYATDPT